MHILIIKPGFGLNKTSLLHHHDKDTTISMPDIPEPTRGEKHDINTGLQILRNDINKFKPDIIMAASRGAIYTLQLLHQNIIPETTPIFCISALKTRELCTVNNSSQPILFCHGTNDDRNTIDRVRIDVATSKVAELVEFEGDGHDLASLETSCGLWVTLLQRLYQRSRSKEMMERWMEKERPDWMERNIMPKIELFEREARKEREEIMNQRNIKGEGGMTVCLLSAIRNKNRDE